MEAINMDQAHLPAHITDRAYDRVDALLRAYGISHSVARSRYCLRILGEAISLREKDTPLETLAARIALKELESGIDQLILSMGVAVEAIDRDHFSLALQRARVPQRFPDAILGNEPLDDDLCELIRRHYESQSAPTLRRVSMGASTLRFDRIDNMTGSTARWFKEHPYLYNLLRAMLWGMFFYAIYFFAR